MPISLPNRKMLLIAAAIGLPLTMIAAAQAPVLDQYRAATPSGGFAAQNAATPTLQPTGSGAQLPARAATLKQSARPLTVVRVPATHAYTAQDNRSFWQRHPIVKGAAIGAGVGAG